MSKGSEKAVAGKGRFNDKVPVHTAPSGTQYVKPFDALFTREEMRSYVEEARKSVQSRNSDSDS